MAEQILNRTDSDEKTPEGVALPEDVIVVLPVRNLVLFPGAVMPVALSRERSVAAAQEAVRSQRKLGLLLQRFFPILFADLLPPNVELIISGRAIVESFLLGFFVVGAFTFLPIYRLNDLKPRFIFRKEYGQARRGWPFYGTIGAIFLFFVGLVLVSIGHMLGRTAPILNDEVPVAEAAQRIIDPVPQALVLTAIVIGLGVTALMLAYAYKLYKTHGSLDISKYTELKW